MEQRFVVEVTERVPPDALDQVARQVAERLKQPPERFAALLGDRIGPVTQPLARAPAEQVAGVLRAAGVHVTVGMVGRESRAAEAARMTRMSEANRRAEVAQRGEVAQRTEVPQRTDVGQGREGAQLPSTRWLPSPHDTFVLDASAHESVAPGGGRGVADLGGEAEGGGVRRPPAAAPGNGAATVSRVREGWLAEDASRRSRAGDPWIEDEASGRSGLRPWLLLALLLALLVLIGLQVGPLLRSAPVGSYDAGLDAYRQGRFVAAGRRWLPVAERGDPRAQFMIGYLSEMGLGRPWSNREAASWYRQAAERGHTLAQAHLASLYARGMGVHHDEAAAVRWYLAAAHGGLLDARFELGLRYLHGKGVSADPEAARRWLTLAAEAGHREAATLAALLTR